MELNIGDIAPDFAMNISEERVIKLSELHGKNVVLYFYPKDDTPGCTIEACNFNALKKEFEAVNAVVLGVSKDDLKSHNKFKSKYDLVFDLASDPNGATCEAYGVWAQKSMFGKKYMGILRTTFLIDPHGKISYIWRDVSVTGHAQEVLDKLRQQ